MQSSESSRDCHAAAFVCRLCWQHVDVSVGAAGAEIGDVMLPGTWSWLKNECTQASGSWLQAFKPQDPCQ